MLANSTALYDSASLRLLCCSSCSFLCLVGFQSELPGNNFEAVGLTNLLEKKDPLKMDIFKVKMFRKAQKLQSGESEEKQVPPTEETENRNVAKDTSESNITDHITQAEVEEEEDGEDDFIMDEVKKRLKELRKKNFMVLIPEEESCQEEEEEEVETSSSEWRDVEAEGRQWWGGFEAVYDNYCERMLFFDRMIMNNLNQTGSQILPSPSPKSGLKKLTSPLRCLYLKKIEKPDDQTEFVEHPENNPHHELETAYVAHICLTWEALHCQFTQLSQKISCQPENPTCYNHSAGQFQQFQVLLQRYIENEPFEQGLRAEIYGRTRRSLPKLLQVPNIQGTDKVEFGGEESDLVIHACDLIKIIQTSILTFHLFLKTDQRKSNGVSIMYADDVAAPLRQILYSLAKKGMKMKEVTKKRKGWKKKAWGENHEDEQMVLGVIDLQVITRVARMRRITKEQVGWCEEKLKKLQVRDGRVRREPSLLLFPG